MEQWEYWTRILNAHIENEGAREFIRRNWPDWEPPKFAPQTLMPALNSMGAAGWELVHMQPVIARDKDEIIQSGGSGISASNAYFCVFKRRVGRAG